METNIAEILETSTANELLEIRQGIEAKLETLKQAKIAEILTDLKAWNIPIQALTNGHKEQKTKSAPKYRNPDNPEQTWTGKGHPPKWIAGIDKEDRKAFEIPS